VTQVNSLNITTGVPELQPRTEWQAQNGTMRQLNSIDCRHSSCMFAVLHNKQNWGAQGHSDSRRSWPQLRRASARHSIHEPSGDVQAQGSRSTSLLLPDLQRPASHLKKPPQRPAAPDLRQGTGSKALQQEEGSPQQASAPLSRHPHGVA
jgi:hypothetical protein